MRQGDLNVSSDAASDPMTEFGSKPQFGDILSDLGGDISGAVSGVTSGLGGAASGLTSGIGDIITNPGKDIAAIQSVISDPGKLIGALGDDFGKVSKFFGDEAGNIGDAIKKAASNSIIQQALQVATGALYMGAALTVGPLALALFAAPGLLEGQSFPQAWLQGVVGQAQRAMKTLSGGSVNLDVLPDSVTDQIASFTQTFNSQMGQAGSFLQGLGPDPSSQLGQLATQLGIPDPTKITPQDIANKLGIREDAAAAALSNALGKLPAPIGPSALQAYKNASFDPTTGLQTYYWPTKIMQYSAQAQKIVSVDPVIQAAYKLHPSSDYQRGFLIGIGACAARLNAEAVQSLQAFIQGGMKSTVGQAYGPPPAAPGTPIQRSAPTPPPPPPTGRVADPSKMIATTLAGFNAALALAKGLGNKLVADLSKANGVYASTKAGHMIMHGLATTPASGAQKAAVAEHITVDPNARAGAAVAVQQIAQDRMSLWQKIMDFLGA